MCLKFQENETALTTTLRPAIVNTTTPSSSMHANGSTKTMADHREIQRLKGTYY